MAHASVHCALRLRTRAAAVVKSAKWLATAAWCAMFFAIVVLANEHQVRVAREEVEADCALVPGPQILTIQYISPRWTPKTD